MSGEGLQEDRKWRNLEKMNGMIPRYIWKKKPQCKMRSWRMRKVTGKSGPNTVTNRTRKGKTRRHRLRRTHSATNSTPIQPLFLFKCPGKEMKKKSKGIMNSPPLPHVGMRVIEKRYRTLHNVQNLWKLMGIPQPCLLAIRSPRPFPRSTSSQDSCKGSP